jgi:hypothetical protein
MGRTCGTYGEEEKCIQGFSGETLREGDHLEDLAVDGRIILNCIFERLDGGIDWIDVAQDRVRRRAVVNTVMNFRIS